MTPVFRVGQALAIVSADERGVLLEGTRRLPPGRVIRLSGPGAEPGRLTLVVHWEIVGAGRDGPRYRGYGRWIDAEPNAAPPLAAP